MASERAVVSSLSGGRRSQSMAVTGAGESERAIFAAQAQ
jgi:hypothetical protein